MIDVSMAGFGAGMGELMLLRTNEKHATGDDRAPEFPNLRRRSTSVPGKTTDLGSF